MIQVKVDPTLGEAEWQKWVIATAALRHWTLQYHTHDSRRSPAGFPDWVFIHEGWGDIVVAELKGYDTPVDPKQLEWINGFRLCGVDAYIWRPRHAQQVAERFWHPSQRCAPEARLPRLEMSDVKP